MEGWEEGRRQEGKKEGKRGQGGIGERERKIKEKKKRRGGKGREKRGRKTCNFLEKHTGPNNCKLYLFVVCLIDLFISTILGTELQSSYI